MATDLDVIPAAPAPTDALPGMPVVPERPVVPEGLHAIDPRSVTLGRLARWPVVPIPLLLSGPGILIPYAVEENLPGLVAIGILAGALLLTALLVIFAHFGPLWRYRYTRYQVDAHGIEIRRGNAWRQVVTVPRSRVQHTDVGQGPLERRYGLATLTIYTAGTEHSAVPLAGLPYERALALRDDLLHAGRADAI